MGEFSPWEIVYYGKLFYVKVGHTFGLHFPILQYVILTKIDSSTLWYHDTGVHIYSAVLISAR
jgi:hypothetical protein